MDPGAIITVVCLAYQGTVKAWSLLRDAYDFPQDSEDLITRFDLERFRLQNWGRQAGLFEGSLHHNLVPIASLIEIRLTKIKKILEDGNQLAQKFCMVHDFADKEVPAKGLLSAVTEALRTRNPSLPVLQELDPQTTLGTDMAREDVPNISRPGLRKRIRWSVSSKSRFEGLLSDLETHINKLKDLLTETQQSSAARDWERVSIIVVGQAQSGEELQSIVDATQKGLHQPTASMLRSLAERKAIEKSGKPQLRSTLGLLSPLNIADFWRPAELATRQRFISSNRSPTDSCNVLFERKGYVSDMTTFEKQILKKRIDRLVMLLGTSSRSDGFRTLQCIGCIDDPASFCWWLVFKYPLQQKIDLKSLNTAQPISLLDHLATKSPYKPPLELRLQLASNLATTLGSLYGSGWLHKGIRSENILFPAATLNQVFGQSGGKYDISEPYVAGFEYSRQDTEAQTIDKAKNVQNLGAAIYWHPDYQGAPAQGYKIQYDMYSFGLVLVEIAWWVPLSSFLDAEMRDPRVRLSSKMKHFGREEALELRRRVLIRLERELAFRVGTTVCDVVRWCLQFADTRVGDEVQDWQPALEIYENVVVPLMTWSNPSHPLESFNIRGQPWLYIYSGAREIRPSCASRCSIDTPRTWRLLRLTSKEMQRMCALSRCRISSEKILRSLKGPRI